MPSDDGEQRNEEVAVEDNKVEDEGRGDEAMEVEEGSMVIGGQEGETGEEEGEMIDLRRSGSEIARQVVVNGAEAEVEPEVSNLERSDSGIVIGGRRERGGGQENDKKRKSILNKWISRDPSPMPRHRSASENIVGFQRGPNGTLLGMGGGRDRSGLGLVGGEGGLAVGGVAAGHRDIRSFSASAVHHSAEHAATIGPFASSASSVGLAQPHHYGGSSVRRAIMGGKGKERMNLGDTFDMLFKKKPKAESTPTLPSIPSFVLTDKNSSSSRSGTAAPCLSPSGDQRGYLSPLHYPGSGIEHSDGCGNVPDFGRSRSNSLPARNRSMSCPIPTDGDSSASQELALEEIICKEIFELMVGSGINHNNSVLKSKVFFASDAVSWMVKSRTVQAREAGVVLCRKMASRGYLLPLHNSKEFHDNSVLWKIKDVEPAVGEKRYKRDSHNLGRRSTSDSQVHNFCGELGEGQLYEVSEQLFHPESGITLRERRHKNKVYYKCFTGSDVVDWMMTHLPIKSRREGVELGKRLMAANYFSFIDAEGAQQFKDRKVFFCLRDDFGGTQKAAVGRLFVKLISAEELGKKLGANNYYCEMSLGLQKTLSSSFAKPEWNEECEFAVWSDSLDNTLNVELWIVADSTAPQRLAKVVVENITSYNTGKPKPCTFKFKRGLLGSEKGQINLTLHYIPNNDISAFKKLEALLCSDFLLVRSIFSAMMGRSRLQTESSYSTSDRLNQGDIASALVHIFNQNGLLLGLLRYMIHMEVENTASENLLFRDESLSSRMMSIFSKLIGRPFLHKHLQPLLAQVLVPEFDLEINPRTVPPDELEVNQGRLLGTAQQFFDSIIGSLDELHYAFKEVSRCLFESVQHRFPDSRYKVVGSFFFLRWLCPSLVTPDAFGLIDQKLESKSRRRLVLIAKVLQNLANEAYFEQKEEYMKCSNVFIESNLDKMHSFFDSLVEKDQENETESGRWTSIAPATRAHLEAVYYYLQQNYGSISNEIRRTESEPTLVVMTPLSARSELELRRRESQESMMATLDEVLKELQDLSKKGQIARSSPT